MAQLTEYERAVRDCQTIIQLTALAERSVLQGSVAIRADFTAQLARSQGREADAIESDALAVKYRAKCQATTDELFALKAAAGWGGDEPIAFVACAACDL